MKRVIQQYQDGDVAVAFRDRKQGTPSAKCHPREIVLVDSNGQDLPDQDSPAHRKIREAIAIDVRRGQGYSDIGIAKGLLW